jgi:hypothetical protein
MLGSLIICLSRFSLDSNVVVGFIDDGRTIQTENSIGLFSNILPVKVNLTDGSRSPFVSEFLASIQRGMGLSKANAVPYLHLVDLLKKDLCQTIFVDQTGLKDDLRLGSELTVTNLDILMKNSSRRPKCDFLFEICEYDTGSNDNIDTKIRRISCRITYNSSRYCVGFIQRVAKTVSLLAKEMKFNLQNRIESLSIICRDQLELMSGIHRLDRFGHSLDRVEYMMSEIARKYPERVAIEGIIF